MGKLKKRWIPGILLIAVLLVVIFTVIKINAFAKTDDTVSIQVASGQEVIYAKLSAVRGNEITYLLATEQEEVEKDENTDQVSSTQGSENWDRENFNKEDVSGSDTMRGGQLPTGSNSGEMPQLPTDSDSGEMPQMEADSDSSEMPQMSTDASGMSGGRGWGQTTESTTSQNTFTYNNVTYTISEEETTKLIPVGTDVTTKLGTVTTFSRLAAGDYVAIIRDIESGEIVSVYIVG